MTISGITSAFAELFLILRKIIYALLTRLPLSQNETLFGSKLPRIVSKGSFDLHA